MLSLHCPLHHVASQKTTSQRATRSIQQAPSLPTMSDLTEAAQTPRASKTLNPHRLLHPSGLPHDFNIIVQQHPLFKSQPASSKQPTFVVLYAIHDEIYKTMPLWTASNISSYLSSVIPHIPRPSSCPLQRNPPPHNINIPLPIRAFVRPIGPGQDVAGGEMWVQSVGCGGADLAYINR